VIRALASALLLVASASAFRGLAARDDAGVAALRRINDRLERLEKGGLTQGLVSFKEVQIGDVLIQCVTTGPTSRDLVFTNILSGATDTITL
jgi:hypothetical protein